MMMFLTKWLSSALAIALLATTASAADTVASGKVKSIDADAKTFVLTDSANKDHTLTFGDKLVVNREGKESKNGLKAGDTINVCYEKGEAAWTAHYILVQEGRSKNCVLIRGHINSYDADTNSFTFTNEAKEKTTYSTGEATVRIDMKNAKIEDVENDSGALLIVDVVNRKSTLHSVMVDRDTN